MKTRTAVILIPCLLTGGTEVATLETARALQALNFQVDVVVYFDEVDPLMLGTFQTAGVSVHLLGLRRDGERFGTLRLAWALWRQLRGQRRGLIWVQYMTPTLVPLLVSRLFARCLVAAVHVAASHYSAADLGRIRLIARYWCSRVVCVSNTVANGIFTKNRVTRVAVIPNALDAHEMLCASVRNWHNELNWPDNCVIIGFAGRLTHFKGADVLLKAVAKLNLLESQLRLVIVGDGDSRAELQGLTEELGMTSITHFYGRIQRQHIFSAIKGFDIAVMPSRPGLEGFGLSALEAMAAGVPLVASDVDALSEVVINGQTGLLFNPEDSSDLAAKLCALIEDKNLRQRLGRAGVAHATKMYDRPAYQARIRALLHGMGLTTRADT